MQINRDQLLLLVRAAICVNRPNPEEPSPPRGPWDPFIRLAVEKVEASGGSSRESLLVFLAKRFPQLWEIIGGGPVGPGGHRFGAEVALNPQPLPPRWIFFTELARAVASRAELVQEIAGAIKGEGDERGIIIVSGYVSRFVDEVCGNGFRLRWPRPGPRPDWFAEEVGGMELLVVAAEMDQAAHEAFSQDLSQTLRNAATKLIETGISRMQ